MFNAEKLLGKIVGEVLGTSHGKKRKKRGSNSLMDNLTSGAGLMTAIGLGVGAFEILRDKKQQGQIQQQTTGYTPPPITSPPAPPAHPGSQTQATPPPLPASENQAAAPPIPTPQAPTQSSPMLPETPTEPTKDPAPSTEDLAITMIQVMIAAAHADGTLDEDEEKAILDKLKDGGLDQEEKMFLLNEMHNPKTIPELIQNITDPAIAKAVYILAVSTINIDTPEERSWLDELAQNIGLSKAVQSFIDEQY